MKNKNWIIAKENPSTLGSQRRGSGHAKAYKYTHKPNRKKFKYNGKKQDVSSFHTKVLISNQVTKTL